MSQETTMPSNQKIKRLSSSAKKQSAISTSMEDSHVKVAVRCRPMAQKEVIDGHKSIVEFEDGKKVIVNNINESPSDHLGTRSGERNNMAQVFDFDAVFDWKSTQEDVYDSVCRPIVDSVLKGFNGTIFAYGQTGTGKTYTMEGETDFRRINPNHPNKRMSLASSSGSHRSESEKSSRRDSNGSIDQEFSVKSNNDHSEGVIPRSFKHIFDYIADRKDIQFLVSASYLEIYQEEIHDLLRKDRTVKLKLHERPDTGVYVKDLTSHVCKSIKDIERVMKVGNQNRKVGATDMNERSSRSHAIFMIKVEQQSTGSVGNFKVQNSMKSVAENENVIRVGRLNLVDLAGSERQRKTNNSGQRHKESIKINLSLSALGNVINSLMKINMQQSNKITSAPGSGTKSVDFIPYRDSKLTRLLQDSLGGNSRTLMIANIGPASYNYDETVNTLNYASRAKCIQNRPKMNEDPKDTLLRELQKEIEDLRGRLSSMNAFGQSNGDLQYLDKKGKSTSDKVQRELFELRRKLSSLEGKLLNGSNNSSDLDHGLLQFYTHEQENQLEKNRAELAERSKRERMIREELERGIETELEVKQSFSSIQQEVDEKRQLIRKILTQNKALQDDYESKQSSYRLELDELDQIQYVLQKELRLKCLIMDNFIPNHQVNQLLPRIVYDDKRNVCSIAPIDLSLDYCNLNPGLVQYSDIFSPTGECIRPRTESERLCETINPSDARYKYDNLIEVKVSRPYFGEPNVLVVPKVEKDLERPPSKIQMLVEAALNQHEPDIVV